MRLWPLILKHKLVLWLLGVLEALGLGPSLELGLHHGLVRRRGHGLILQHLEFAYVGRVIQGCLGLRLRLGFGLRLELGLRLKVGHMLRLRLIFRLVCGRPSIPDQGFNVQRLVG